MNDDGGGIGLYNYALGEVRDANMVVDRYFAVDNFGNLPYYFCPLHPLH